MKSELNKNIIFSFIFAICIFSICWLSYSEPKVCLLLVILISTLIYAFRLLIDDNKSRDRYIFFSFTLVLFILIYSVSILNYKISGDHLSVEVRQQLAKTNAQVNDISKVVSTLLKINAITVDGSGRYDGVPPEHTQKIKEYQASLADYIEEDLSKEIDSTIEQLNKEINKKNTSK